MKSITRERYTGCLLGGAVGDALGWPVEFEQMRNIRALFGPCGITGMETGEDRRYEITDDTQMTLFTAEGLLRAWGAVQRDGSDPDFTSALRRSYLCWLVTQKERGYPLKEIFTRDEIAGWLLSEEGLHRRRAPGDTCLSALRELSRAEIDRAKNDSKGCGGVMRTAPAGLFAVRISTGDIADCARLAFELGCEAAALTHGNPSGSYPAGILAALIAAILRGRSIEEGVELALGVLEGCTLAEETAEALRKALFLSRDGELAPSPEVVESFGGGWVGHEALAISVYCALSSGGDFARGVRLAVNHSGDSDSTGAITGNILGALLGESAIPRDWLDRLELFDVIHQVGCDLFTTFEDTQNWVDKYPSV